MRQPLSPMHLDPLPTQCLVDDALEIRVRGLRPGQAATFTLCSRFSDQLTVASRACFHADGAGVIDLCRHAPVSGAYQGVDPMGLFWSRSPVPQGEVVDAADLGNDPWTATLVVESADPAARLIHAVRRVYLGAGVTVRQVDHGGLVGKLFEHEDQVPRPSVLVVGGSNGGLGWSQEAAALLASHGFTVLALAYFAAPGLPPTLDRIPLEYFEAALQWLASQPSVAPGGSGVVGVSRGGELALLLGAHSAQVRCVVAYVPSGVVWPAYPASGHGAWTLNGAEIPYASTLSHEQWDALLASGQALAGSFDWYLLPLRDPAYLESVSIPVERIRGPVLLISGADDGLWPSTDLAQLAVNRAQEKHFPHAIEHLVYQGAGHSIAWPGGPTTMLRSVHPVSGEDMDMGGTPQGNAQARVDSWPRVLAFLHRALQGD
ncbi:MAG: acyl-CoA thioesterase/bile acid-CoA:amino acid N-acyltransferase family protein [Pseudomonadota bacterium]